MIPVRLLALCSLLLLQAMIRADAAEFVVEPVPEWNALFDRDSGWTGADGIYAIPLDGYDSVGNAHTGYTLWLFSDTFIGEVDETGSRIDGSVLVNNTLALMYGDAPDPGNIEFIWRGMSRNEPDAVFTPGTPSALPEHWYWLQDGVVINDTLHLFPLRMKPFQNFFAVDGVTMISAPVRRHQPLADAVEVETPLFHIPVDGRGELIFGTSVLVNTDSAGSPSPDGYVYIYGTQNDPLNKKLLVARVLPKQFEDFDAWRFWNGTDWVAGIDNSKAMTGRLSSELSVSPLPDGRYILVFQVDTISAYVGIRLGDSPAGPWGPLIPIYTAPEAGLDPDIYTYNAKAYPHLSAPGELLISYNVNTLDFWDHFTYADIYRPRFIRLILQ